MERDDAGQFEEDGAGQFEEDGAGQFEEDGSQQFEQAGSQQFEQDGSQQLEEDGSQQFEQLVHNSSNRLVFNSWKRMVFNSWKRMVHNSWKRMVSNSWKRMVHNSWKRMVFNSWKRMVHNSWKRMVSTVEEDGSTTVRTGWFSTVGRGWFTTVGRGWFGTVGRGWFTTVGRGWFSTVGRGWFTTVRTGWFSTVGRGWFTTVRTGWFSTVGRGWIATVGRGWFSTVGRGWFTTVGRGWFSTVRRGWFTTVRTGWFSTVRRGWFTTVGRGWCCTADQFDESISNIGNITGTQENEFNLPTSSILGNSSTSLPVTDIISEEDPIGQEGTAAEQSEIQELLEQEDLSKTYSAFYHKGTHVILSEKDNLPTVIRGGMYSFREQSFNVEDIISDPSKKIDILCVTLNNEDSITSTTDNNKQNIIVEFTGQRIHEISLLKEKARVARQPLQEDELSIGFNCFYPGGCYFYDYSFNASSQKAEVFPLFLSESEFSFCVKKIITKDKIKGILGDLGLGCEISDDEYNLGDEYAYYKIKIINLIPQIGQLHLGGTYVNNNLVLDYGQYKWEYFELMEEYIPELKDIRKELQKSSHMYYTYSL